MAPSKCPSLPIPEPLRGSKIGSFAHDTVVRRLPDIVRRTIAENDFSPNVVNTLQNLIDDIPEAQIRLLDDPDAPDREGWDHYVESYLGMNWLEVPWFFAEFYLYRRILEAIRYFRKTETGHLHDPYWLQKKRGLENLQHTMQYLCAQSNRWIDQHGDGREALGKMLLLDLWGNKADLSIWPQGEGDLGNNRQQWGDTEHLVVNDTKMLVEYLVNLEPGEARIDLLLDNAGMELTADLILTDFLLSKGYAHTVVLHPKSYPVFVSDALRKDVEETISYLEGRSISDCSLVGKRLQAFLGSGRLIYRQHTFWTSPLPFWEMPEDLRAFLERSNLVISKGDANYRRLLGDRHWTFTTPFEHILSFIPAPLLVLRTCKSDVMCGLAAGQEDSLTVKDPEWMTNGQWGLIQFKS
jgi:uncharacterized protein with ATP-grasp and redox domains